MAGTMASPEQAPSPPPLPSLTFGGYAGQPGQLEGVGFWPRVLARVVDLVAHYFVMLFAGFGFGIMVGIAAVLTHTSTDAALAKFQGERFLPFLAGLVGATAYEIVCEAGHGSTLGKLVLGMTVVQEDGSFCRLGSAVKRSLAYYLDSLFFGLVGYFEMKGSPSEQRHGDKWAKTVVCKRSKLRPDQLRSGGRFAAMLLLGMAADAAAFLVSLTLVLVM
jgi:uncharacterized RDD family membrane protein YckC